MVTRGKNNGGEVLEADRSRHLLLNDASQWKQRRLAPNHQMDSNALERDTHTTQTW